MKTALALSVLSALLTQSAFANEPAAAIDTQSRPSVTVLSKEQAQNKIADAATVVIMTNQSVQVTNSNPGVTTVKVASSKPAPTKKVAVRKSAPLARGGSILAVPVTALSQKPLETPRRPHVVASSGVTSTVVDSKLQGPDLAAESLKACLLKESVQKKSAIACMNKELRDAETLLDSAEVRLFNCAELRKIEKAGEPTLISQLVVSRRDQLRARAQADFKTELESAGKIGPRKTREIELRATLKHLGAVTKLNKKVCNSAAFTALLSK